MAPGPRSAAARAVATATSGHSAAEAGPPSLPIGWYSCQSELSPASLLLKSAGCGGVVCEGSFVAPLCWSEIPLEWEMKGPQPLCLGEKTQHTTRFLT